jgi:hypothetical protein
VPDGGAWNRCKGVYALRAPVVPFWPAIGPLAFCPLEVAGAGVGDGDAHRGRGLFPSDPGGQGPVEVGGVAYHSADGFRGRQEFQLLSVGERWAGARVGVPGRVVAALGDEYGDRAGEGVALRQLGEPGRESQQCGELKVIGPTHRTGLGLFGCCRARA